MLAVETRAAESQSRSDGRHPLVPLLTLARAESASDRTAEGDDASPVVDHQKPGPANQDAAQTSPTKGCALATFARVLSSTRT